jgi:hypothetical protein
MLGDVLTVVTVLNICLLLGMAIAVSKRARISSAHLRFSILLFLVATWVTLRFFENVFVAKTILAHSDFALAAIIAGLFASFTQHFPLKNSHLTLKKELIFFLPNFLLAILSYSNLFLETITNREAIYHSAYYVYIAILIIYFFFGIVILIRKFVSSFGIPRQQLTYFLIGCAISISILLYDSISNSLLGTRPIIFDRVMFNASLLFTLLSGYAMLKYRFLDIRVALQRGTTRILSFLIIFCLYLVGLLIARDALVARSNDLTAIIIVALVVAVTVEPLRKFVFRFVDKAFASHDEKTARTQKRVELLLKSQQSYDGLLTEIQNVFTEFAEVNEVKFIESSDQFFSKRRGTYEFLKSTGRLIIPEELPYRFVEDERFPIIAEELKDASLSCIMAIGQSSSFIGALTLNERKGKKAYSEQDISELKRLQMQFGHALFNARLYKQAVQRITK